jgi:hypothetical protein
VTAALRVLHDRSIASRSPKGEGFTDPIWATLNQLTKEIGPQLGTILT